MKAWIIMLSPLFALLDAPAAQAQMTLDVSQITCRQFVFDQITDVKTLTIWLNGYFNALRNNTVIDVGAFERNSDALQSYCLNNHMEVKLMDAVKDTLGVNK